MTLPVVLSLAAALCWGSSGFLSGLQSRQLPPLTLALWSQIAGAVYIGVALLMQRESPVTGSVAWGAGAGIIGAIALLLFYHALAVGLISIVVPVSACGAVVPVLIALAGGEVPSVLALAGIAAVLGGVVLVSLQPASPGHTSGRARTSLGLALAAAAGFGTFFVLLDRGASVPGASTLWTVAAARVALLVLLLSGSAAHWRAARWPGRHIGAVVAIGIADTTGTMLFAYASRQGNLGIVAVLGSLYPVVALFLGRTILAERLRQPQAAGVALALAGVGLVAGS